jgi:hypothetical protein
MLTIAGGIVLGALGALLIPLVPRVLWRSLAEDLEAIQWSLGIAVLATIAILLLIKAPEILGALLALAAPVLGVAGVTWLVRRWWRTRT